MFIKNQVNKTVGVYHEYPRTFWILVGSVFIDRLGGALIYPFFALYITSKFQVGMTEVGVLFFLFSISSFVGSFLGGALTDRLGRKRMIIFSLIASSASSVFMGLVGSLEAFYVLALVSGIFTDIGGPAQQAIVADLLPERQRAQGYGIIRVAFNLSVAIGPVIGGIIASRSYLALFIADAVISLITASIVVTSIPETKPKLQPGEEEESMAASFGGYGKALRDSPFMLFAMLNILVALVYMNFNTTLGVFLRDWHGISEAGYGSLISLNATMVVLFQFWITRRIEKYRPFMMIAIGALLYGMGFGMYGFVSSFPMFAVAMAVLTIGEMIATPTSQAIVAKLSPEQMRGRYMALFGYSWGISYAIGPYLAGMIMDNFNPNFLWYACLLIGSISAVGFLAMQRFSQRQPAAEAAS
jgi:MFS family permease